MRRSELRKKMEEASKARKAKKGFMTADRKKKLRVGVTPVILDHPNIGEITNNLLPLLLPSSFPFYDNTFYLNVFTFVLYVFIH